MATITVTIPDTLAAEMNETAVRHGFASSKEMLARFIKSQLRQARLDKFEDSNAQSKKDIEVTWANDIKGINVQ